MRKINLVLAKEEDAVLLHELQYKAFLPLYMKYHDDETNPVKETLERTKQKIIEENSEYYIINVDDIVVGGIRITRKRSKNDKSEIEYIQNVNFISPLFILPEYQNQSIGQNVIHQIFCKYPNTIKWILYTIAQEKINCHLYEKCGFIKVGDDEIINEQMTLIRYEKQM